MEKEINSKASKNELDVKLSNKPSHSEMNKLFSKCISKLDKKMDIADSILTGKLLDLLFYSKIAEDMTKLENKFIDKRDFSYLKEQINEINMKIITRV